MRWKMMCRFRFNLYRNETIYTAHPNQQIGPVTTTTPPTWLLRTGYSLGYRLSTEPCFWNSVSERSRVTDGVGD